MTYKVFIPTAGIGSRLGQLTKSLNKSLVSLDNKPIISHLIDKFPEDCDFVIALGYKGNLVKEYLQNLYPNKKIEFVFINPFIGEGSGLGFTLFSAFNHLQEPFVFISCDTLVLEDIPPPEQNWAAYSKEFNISDYRTLEVKSNLVTNFKEKGEGLKGIDFPYIGLSGINDYSSFWDGMKGARKNNQDIGEVSGLTKLIENGIKSLEMTWFDTGNLRSLEFAKQKFKSNSSPVILEKKDEAIWFVKNKVIKYSSNKEFIKNRVFRATKIKDFVPEIIHSSENMYIYKKADGVVLSRNSNIPIFQELLNTSKVFWQKQDLNDSLKKDFQKSCLFFYKNKTQKRIKKFFRDFNKNDITQIINGEKVKSISELFKDINWDYLSEGIPVRFHGDFHFENILWNEASNKFIFLDWRQDFGGSIEYGDIYYDLAKLLHGLIVSHQLIKDGHFKVDWQLNKVDFELKRFQRDVEFEDYYIKWCINNNYDVKKIKILTALIYLNIAPLHHVPYNYFLFALGKLMLHREINN